MGIRVNAILPGVIKTPMVSDELLEKVKTLSSHLNQAQPRPRRIRALTPALALSVLAQRPDGPRRQAGGNRVGGDIPAV